MEVFPGKRKNSHLYVYEGYTYYVDKRYTYTFRCSKRSILQCSGLLIKEGEKYVLHKEHNHPKDDHVSNVLKMKKEMLEMSKDTTASNKDIFDTISRKDPATAANISYNSMRTILSREKLKMRPELPSDSSNLDTLLSNYETIKSMYKGYVISSDKKYSFFFTSDKLLKILAESSEIFIDATFSVVPRTPHFAQLFSIHIRYMDKGIPVVFILSEGRTQFVYNSVWEEIVKLAPGIEQNLQFIMMDYERASIKAVHEKFPNASIHGCWFHFCQAVLRKWKRLNLIHAPNNVLSMTMNLPLVPSHMFSEGLRLIQVAADEDSENYQSILIFVRYLRTTWLPSASKVSVYGCPVRTNNIVESFHNIMSRKMQTVHPNLWIFLDNISKLIVDKEIQYDRLKNGVSVSRNRSRYNKYRNSRIREAQENLINGVYSLKEFLCLNIDDKYEQLNKIVECETDEDEVYCDLHADDRRTVSPEIIRREPLRKRRERRLLCSANIDVAKSGEEVHYVSNEIYETSNIQGKEEGEEEEEGEKEGEKEEARNVSNDQSTCNTSNNSKDTFDCNENVTITQNSPITNASSYAFDTSDSDNDCYRIPQDDYGYWLNNGNEEENNKETPNVPVNIIFDTNKNLIQYNEKICIICMSEKRDTVFLPCKHFCCCKVCVEQLQEKKCPIYNTAYDDFMPILIP